MIVVDASVVVKWFVPEGGSLAAHRLLQHGETFIAPDSVVLETLNVLRRKSKKGDISTDQLGRIAGAVHRYFSELVPAADLAQRATDLALMLNHPVYDCAYLACALQQSVPLLTADDAFYRKAIANRFQDHVSLL